LRRAPWSDDVQSAQETPQDESGEREDQQFEQKIDRPMALEGQRLFPVVMGHFRYLANTLSRRERVGPKDRGEGFYAKVVFASALKTSDTFGMNGKHAAIARRLRRDTTGPEAILWRELRNSRLDGLKFRRQTPIAGYIVDFCCYSLGLTIELDGKHHADQPLSDAERRPAIETHGYLELRFTNDEVKERLDWVLQEIRRAADIARARKPRAPAPRLD